MLRLSVPDVRVVNRTRQPTIALLQRVAANNVLKSDHVRTGLTHKLMTKFKTISAAINPAIDDAYTVDTGTNRHVGNNASFITVMLRYLAQADDGSIVLQQ